MKTWLTLFLLSLLFTGCNSGVQSNLNDEQSKTEIISKGINVTKKASSYTIIKKSDYPIMIETAKAVETFYSDDAKDVAAFKETYLNLSNEIAPTFEGTMIVATMGKQRTGGYSIVVESVKDNGRFMDVTLSYKKPTGLATMALTNPYIIIHLPQNHKEVRILEK